VMKRPVFAANWKMNNGLEEARSYFRVFLERYSPREDRSVLFFPSALVLKLVADELRARSDLKVGIQNVWMEAKGAFTGENSPVVAREAGAELALVGHSERRHLFGETEADSAKKCAAAVRAGLTPVLCVGEQLHEREAGDTERVVVRQLDAGLSSIGESDVAGLAVAYEPVWAIGTGLTAAPADASAVHRALREALARRIGSRAQAVPILYGGSVNRGNARALLAAPEVDGLLVGGSCLDPVGWAEICNT
jgi:triosephosphate isomerase